MRAVDLAVFADTLAAEASALAARLERSRARLRQASIEREARRTLGEETLAKLECFGLLSGCDSRQERAEAAELAAALAALEEVQAWVEQRLFAAKEEGYAMTE